MTIIACDARLGVMVADAIITTDAGRAISGSVQKIFHGPGGVVGGAAGGTVRAGVFNEWLQTSRRKKVPLDVFTGDEAAEGLILTHDGNILWYMSPIPEKVLSKIFAIGYGAPLFMAAVEAGADIYEAVEIACKLTTVCGGPTTVLRPEKPKH